MGEDCCAFLLTDLEMGRAVVSGDLGMIEGLGLPGGLGILKIIKEKIMQQPCPSGASGVQAEFFRQVPGNVRDIQAVEQPGSIVMLR